MQPEERTAPASESAPTAPGLAPSMAEQLQPLVDSIARPALAFDPAGIVRAINDAAEELLGVTRGFIVGQGVELTNSLYVKQEIRQARTATVAAAGRCWEGDWIKVHASGQEIPARVRACALPGGSATVEIVVSSEEGPTAAELERRLMSGLAELAPIGLAILDAKCSILYTNPAFEKQFNRGNRVPAGVGLARFFETADYLRLFGGGPRQTRTNPDREPAMLTAPDGTTKPVRVSASDIADELGRVSFRIATIEDLSELEGAREDAGLMLEAARHMGEALLFTDPSGTVFFASKSAEALFGKPEDALIGAKVDELLATDALARARAAGERVSFAARPRIASGRPSARGVTGFPVAGRGGRQIAWGWLVSRPQRKPKLQTPSGS
ncbi:MAG: PAS domain-containing protein [Candidatus Wallbacteria bacterium]|nr:PAS domain-containing protein [Candidatus Wallbacteria bacterium]